MAGKKLFNWGIFKIHVVEALRCLYVRLSSGRAGGLRGAWEEEPAVLVQPRRGLLSLGVKPLPSAQPSVGCKRCCYVLFVSISNSTK